MASLSDGLKDMLVVQFAEKGNNARKLQEQAFVHFLDILDQCSGSYVAIPISLIFQFIYR